MDRDAPATWLAAREVSQDRHAAQRLCDKSATTRAPTPTCAAWRASTGVMSEIQPIIHRAAVAALVLAG
ncbi:MAG: hypothetical protein ACLP0J_03815 [Solirubrobacteraceae bacterium]|jgi:hypothetical protein